MSDRFEVIPGEGEARWACPPPRVYRIHDRKKGCSVTAYDLESRAAIVARYLNDVETGVIPFKTKPKEAA